jgi:cytochrome c
VSQTQLFERVFPLSFFLGLVLSSTTMANEALIEAGAKQVMVCKACHQIKPDGETLVGPPLWGLANRDIAGYESFEYSEGLKQQQGKWNAEKLNAFLASPSEFAPDTKMVFPGVADAGARAAIIAWLATQNAETPDWILATSGAPVKSPGEGILAPGDNMELVAAVCSACHSLHLVKQQGLSKESWDETLEWMVDEQGMDELAPEDHEAVLVYLSTYYGL